ncbi:MAG: serine protease [Xanthomonadaceae bacterium]|nr:serine protease [Xanthomonadaceae bacterium]
MDPAQVIVPIFGRAKNGDIAQFLGTGFFVGLEGLLMTADHVVRDWDGGLAIVCMRDLSLAYEADIVESDRAHDIALLRVETFRPPTVLELDFDSPIRPNIQVMTFEYGTTTVERGKIVLSPATRMGNVTRLRDMSLLGPAGANALEVSFPALRGASGAPIMRADTYRVWGVIVANVSSHLLPAQIESVLDEKNNIYEETRFMLPQAAAVNIRFARAMYQRHAKGGSAA